MGTGTGAGRLGLTGWCAATVLVSAFLLFQVQPVASKMILPWFGGSPAVWTTCMLFFQIFLLLGYLYAHLLDRMPSTRYQGAIHLGLLLAALIVLPIIPSPSWKPVDSDRPEWRILWLLTANVGLPYFLLAANAPLVQAWYSRAFDGRSPYRFYALSNIGSLGALLTYPFLVEPRFDIPSQSVLWSSGFITFAILNGALALTMLRWDLPAVHATDQGDGTGMESRAPSLWTYSKWLILPAFGSMSLLAVTNQICQDVAVVPFFWVVPLSLYLLTFIICFDSERWYLRNVTAAATMLVVVMIAGILLSGRVQPLVDRFEPLLSLMGIGAEVPSFLDSLTMEVVLFLSALFLICMLCHGELVRSKPGPRHLTLFYLMIAGGGAVGGMFVAVVCPKIFTSYAESDVFLMGGFFLAAFVVLQTWCRRENHWWIWWQAAFALPLRICRDLFSTLFGRNRATRDARQQQICDLAVDLKQRRKWYTCWSVFVPIPVLCASALVVLIPIHNMESDDEETDEIYAARSFYGVLRVEQSGSDGYDARRSLYNGRILHGVQYLRASRRQQPTTYYNESSGIGLTLLNLPNAEPMRVATVGLGTGTIASYGQPGDYYCFYEICPEVDHLSREYFTYRSESPAEVRVLLGDARLSMEQQEPQDYDVIALDAFSGDAIPAHLLTVEAFAVYLKHLKPTGVIAVHTSNRHLDLQPIVALLAAHYQMDVVAVDADDGGEVADSSSEWLLVTNNQEFLNTQDVYDASWELDEPAAEIRVWTDQYSNLFQIMKNWQSAPEEDSDEESKQDDEPPESD